MRANRRRDASTEKATRRHPAGDGEHGFLDLGHGVMPDLLELDMRHVRHLVSRHHGVDDGRSVDRQRFAHRGFQLTRLARGKSAAAAGARQAWKIGIGEFDGFAERHDANALGFQRD